MKKGALIARLLVLTGAVLLIAAGVAAYPYVHSRWAGPSSAAATIAPEEHMSPTPPTESADPHGEDATLPTQESSPSPTPASVSTSAPPVTGEPVEPTAEALNTSPPSRILVPSLGIDGPVVPVSEQRTQVNGQTQLSWEVPDYYAAGWHQKSALVGERGNMVLNGHNTSHGEIFRDLYTLQIGDEIVVYSEELSRTYTVTETLILPEAGQPMEVRLANARYVMPTDDERLTLVTCHPYGSLRNRLIVIATPSRPEELLFLPEAQ